MTIEGFYMLRLVKGGPYVAARVFRSCPIDPDFGFPIDRPRPLLAEVDGKPAHEFRAPLAPKGLDFRMTAEDVAAFGTPIRAAEFEYLRSCAEHERRHAPDMPRANPREKIDHGALRPLF